MEEKEFEMDVDDVIESIRRKNGLVVEKHDPAIAVMCLLLEQNSRIEQIRFDLIEKQVSEAISGCENVLKTYTEGLKEVSQEILAEQHENYEELLKKIPLQHHNCESDLEQKVNKEHIQLVLQGLTLLGVILLFFVSLVS